MDVANEKYYFNPYLRCIICNEDELLVKHGSRSSFSIVLKDEKKTRLLGKVAKHFRSPLSVNDFYLQGQISDKKLKEEVIPLINTLYEQNILIKPSENSADVYFRTILKGEENGTFSSLQFGVIGSGDLGKRVITNLLNFRPNKIIFYDERKYTSNPHGMTSAYPFLYSEGGTYTDSFMAYLSGLGINNINGITGRFDDQKKIKEIFENNDFVIICVEFFSPKLLHTVNQVAISVGKPWMSVLIDGSLAIIGPIYVPGETLCYSEFETQVESSMQYFDEYSLYREHLEQEDVSTPPILPPLLDITSGYALMFISRFVLKKKSSLLDKAIFINFEDMSLDSQHLLKLPRCPACQGTRPPYKNSFV